MKVNAIVLALSGAALIACVSSSNECPAGFEYSSQYDACLGTDGGADAAPPSAATTAAGDAGASEGGSGEGGATGSATGFASTCNASTDCTGSATYCLKSPTSPTSPGYCTFTGCTAAQCTGAYACCTCTSSSIAGLASYPPGVCVPSDDEGQVTALGCTCL